jgi:hypothetical protein
LSRCNFHAQGENHPFLFCKNIGNDVLAHVSLAEEHHLYFYKESDVDEPLTDMKGCCCRAKTSPENVFYFFSVGLAIPEEGVSKLCKRTSKLVKYMRQQAELALLTNHSSPNLQIVLHAILLCSSDFYI